MRKIYLWLGIAAVGVYAAAGNVFFDADGQDLQQVRKMNVASLFHDPDPGDVYAYDNQLGAWNATPVCALHQAEAETHLDIDTLKGMNHWGIAINSALGSMDNATNASMFSFLRVRNAEREWTFEKAFRSSQLSTPIDLDCLADAHSKSSDPKWTLFVVDAVFEPKTEAALPLVRFKDMPIQPASCAPTCDGNVRLEDIIHASRVAKLKDAWDIVQVH